MDKKKWLLSYREAKEDAERAYERAERLRCKVHGLSREISDMPRNPSPERADEKMVHLIMIIDEWRDLEEKAEEKARQVLAAINEIEDSDVRRVMKCYYIECLTGHEIAKKLSMDESNVWRLRKKGIEAIKIQN